MKYKFNKFITEISEFRRYQVCETTIILADTLEQAWESFSNIDPEKSKTIETVCEEEA